MDSHNLPSYLFMPRNTKAFVPRVNFILRSSRRSLCFFAFFLARFRDPCSIGFRSNSSQQRYQRFWIYSRTVNRDENPRIDRIPSILENSISIFAIVFRQKLYFPLNISTVRALDVTSCPRASPFPAKFNFSISKILPSRDEKFFRFAYHRTYIGE